MANKLIALLVAFGIPIIFALFVYSDTLNLIGRKNQPKLKRWFTYEESTKQSKGRVAVTGVEFKDTLWHTIPPFYLDGHNGNKISNATFKDKITVVDFFFTYCPTICPKMSSELARVQLEMEKEEDVMILSHTVDPKRDSVAVLKEYGDRYEADSTRWIFVTGDKKEIYDLARYGYFVTASEGSGGDDDFIHTNKFILVDKSGVIRGYYDGTDTEDVNRLLVDIKILKLEYPRKKKGVM